MAYSNGTFLGSDDFTVVFSKLAAFCATAGWTVNQNAFPSLAVNNGACFVNMFFAETDTVDDTLGPTANPNSPDYRIRAWLSNAYPSSDDNNRVTDAQLDYSISNDWKGPYSQYWLFSGGEDEPPYVYMVVQKANGNFCYFGFGTADKKGVTYNGGDFIDNVFWNWWFANGSQIQSFEGSFQGSDAFGQNSNFPGCSDGANQVNGQYQVRLGDINTAKPYVTGRANLGGVPYQWPMQSMVFRGGKPLSVESYAQSSICWLGQIYWMGPNPVNGATPLFEVPFFYQDQGNNRLISLGSRPNYRACSMIGRTEAEEITFGSDDWIVFPIKRYQPYIPEPFATRTVTSGPYAHAFKVIT